MSAVAIIRALLVAHAPAVAIVGNRIFAGVVPQGALMPAIAITEISRTELNTASLSQPHVQIRARVQVTVFAKDYATVKAMIAAVKLDGGSHTGVIGGYQVKAVLRDVVGPDLEDPDTEILQQSRDFMVAYIEMN